MSLSIKHKDVVFPFLSFLAGCAVSAVAQHVIDKKIIDYPERILACVMVGLMLLGFLFLANFNEMRALMGQLIGKAADIDSRIGVRVRYVERSESEGQAVIFRELRKVVERAEKQIVIVNYSDKMSTGAEASGEEKMYYDSLLQRVKGRGIEYWRIIQVGERAIQDLVAGSEYLRHFNAMLDEKESSRSLVHLDKVIASRPLTFTLVDDHLLMLQLDEKTADGFRMHGVFIFEDPQRVLISHFHAFYKEIISNSLGAIQRSELTAVKS